MINRNDRHPGSLQNGKGRRLLALLLSLMLLISSTGITAFAEEEIISDPATAPVTDPAEETPPPEDPDAPSEEPGPSEDPDATPEPADEGTETPSEEATETPVEETTEQPGEETTDAPQEESADQPEEETTEEPEVTEEPILYSAGELEAEAAGARVRLEYPAEARIPEDVTLSMAAAQGTELYAALKSASRQIRNGQDETWSRQVAEDGYQFYTLSITDAEGNAIQPASGVTLTYENPESPEGVEYYLTGSDERPLTVSGGTVVIDNYAMDPFGYVRVEKTQIGNVTLTYTTQDYKVTAVYGPEAALPADTELKVREILPGTEEYAQCSGMTEDALSQDWSEVTLERYFDITFVSGGESKEPSADVDVQILFRSSIRLTEEDDMQAVHIQNDEATVIESGTDSNASARYKDEAIDTVTFSSDSFSIYGVVRTKKITRKVLAANGDTYEIQVSYGPEAEIPEDAELKVVEILEGSDLWEAYRKQTAAALGSDDVRMPGLFDITLISGETGKDVPLSAPISVSITLDKAETDKEIQVVHFTEDLPEELVAAAAEESQKEQTEVQTLEPLAEEDRIESQTITDASTEGNTVTFETQGFSVYAFAYTVDFHYEGVDYSIEGESQILLSELIGILNIHDEAGNLINVTEVASVAFTDEHLVTVQEVSGLITYNNAENTDVGEKDFLLTSLEPFTSDETLTITLTSGEEIIVGVTDAQEVPESSNLVDFLTNANLSGAVKNSDGTYSLESDKNYTLSLVFKESGLRQFANYSTLTYTLPEGLIVPEYGKETLYVAITNNGVTYQVPYTVEVNTDRTMKITFDQTAEFFNKLASSTNVTLRPTINVKLAQSTETLRFSDTLVFTTDVDNSKVKPDVSINKYAYFDQATGRFTYTITAKATGAAAANVNIKDVISGNALTNIGNFQISGNSVQPTGSQLSSTGFDLTFASMQKDEEITITYTADVDYSKDTDNDGKITADQTKNSASASSNGTDPHTSEYSYQVAYSTITKENANATDKSGTVTTLSWEVNVNPERVVSLAGTSFTDNISTGSYSGTGLMIEVYEDSSNAWNLTSTRTVTWSELGVNDSSKSFTYNFPSSDGKYRYVFKYTTQLDTGSTSNDVVVNNTASYRYGSTSSTGTVQADENNKLAIDKQVVSYSNSEVEWKVILHVPPAGLDEAVIDDVLPSGYYIAPRESIEQHYVSDTFVEGSLNISGLLSGENYTTSTNTDNEHKDHLVITFTKNSSSGLSPTSAGRDIIVTYRTLVNQEWLEDAAYRSYDVWRMTHENKAKIGSLEKKAGVTLGNPGISKGTPEKKTITIEGIQRTVFMYNIVLKNCFDNSVTVSDEFDTNIFKVLSSDNQVDNSNYINMYIYGGDQYNQYNGRMPINYTDTANGITFRNDSLPKDSNGVPYSYYRICYYLLLKDDVDLDQLAAQNGGTYIIKNNATWKGITATSEYPVEYDALSKEIISTDGQYDTFRIKFNSNKAELNGGEDMQMTDVLGDKLSLDYSSVSITTDPSGYYVPYTVSGVKDSNGDPTGESIIKLTIPDSTEITVTYRALVVGSGKVKVQNTVNVLGYQKKIDQEQNMTISGGGEGSLYRLTVSKVDGYDASKKLAGARFKLTAADDPNTVLKTYTSDNNGVIVIDGNEVSLYPGKQYKLTEIEVPYGYEAIGFDYLITFHDDIDEVDYDTYNYYYTDFMQIKNWPKEATTIDIGIDKTWLTESEDEWPSGVSATFKLRKKSSVDGTVSDLTEEDLGDSWAGFSATATLSSASTGSIWTGLPELTGYTYVVEETEVEGYTAYYKDTDDTFKQGVTAPVISGKAIFKNVSISAKTGLTVTKEWHEISRDGTDTTKATGNSVTMKLYRTTDTISDSDYNGSIVRILKNGGSKPFTLTGDTIAKAGDTVRISVTSSASISVDWYDTNNNADSYHGSGAWGTASSGSVLEKVIGDDVQTLYLGHWTDGIDYADFVVNVQVIPNTPSSLTTELSPVEEFTLSESNGWTYTNDNLDKYDNEGNEYHYFVVENDAASSTQYVLGTDTLSEKTVDAWTVKNYTVESTTTSITVQKEWSDPSNSHNPVQIKLIRYKKGTAIQPDDETDGTINLSHVLTAEDLTSVPAGFTYTASDGTNTYTLNTGNNTIPAGTYSITVNDSSVNHPTTHTYGTTTVSSSSVTVAAGETCYVTVTSTYTKKDTGGGSGALASIDIYQGNYGHNTKYSNNEKFHEGETVVVTWTRQGQAPGGYTVNGGEKVSFTGSGGDRVTDIVVFTIPSSGEYKGKLIIELDDSWGDCKDFDVKTQETSKYINLKSFRLIASAGVSSLGGSTGMPDTYGVDTSFSQTITLSAGHWSEVISGLDMYDGEGNVYYYGIEEESVPEGYTVSYDDNQPYIATRNSIVLTATNTSDNPTTGSLTVTKTVGGNAGNTETEFNFTVTLSDTTINTTHGEMIFENGVATFALKHGESKTATGLPDGTTYTVVETEDGQNGYVTTKAGETGSIVAGETQTAAFTNTRQINDGSIELSKAVSSEDEADKDIDFSFTITILKTNETTGEDEIDTSFSGTYGGVTFTEGVTTTTLKHGNSVTISSLPYGTKYRIEEDTSSTFQTTATVGEEEAEDLPVEGTITSETSVAIVFTNTRIPTIDITATKSWDTEDDSKKANAVQFTLYKQVGEDTDGAIRIVGDTTNWYVAIDSKTLLDTGDSNAWKATWTDLPQYVNPTAETPAATVYAVRETGVFFGTIPEDVSAITWIDPYMYIVSGGTASDDYVITNALATVDVPVQKTWADYESDEYSWIARFQLQKAQVLSDNTMSDWEYIYETVSGENIIKTVEVTKKDNGVVTIPGLPLYAFNNDGTVNRLVYSINEVYYKAWKTADETDVVAEWDHYDSSNNKATNGAFYTPDYLKDAGEGTMPQSGMTEWYTISVSNRITNREGATHLNISLEKAWDDSSISARDDASAQFRLMRYVTVGHTNYSGVSDLNDKVTVKFSDNSQSIEVPKGAYIRISAKATGKDNVLFKYKSKNTDDPNAQYGSETECRLNGDAEYLYSSPIQVMNGLEIQIASYQNVADLTITDIVEVEAAQPDASWTPVSFTVNKNGNWHYERDNLLKSEFESGTNSTTYYHYSYYLEEVSSNPDGYYAEFTSSGAELGDISHRISENASIIATNKEKEPFRVSKQWLSILSDDLVYYPEVSFTLYQLPQGQDYVNAANVYRPGGPTDNSFVNIKLNYQNKWTWDCPVQLPKTYEENGETKTWKYCVVETPKDSSQLLSDTVWTNPAYNTIDSGSDSNLRITIEGYKSRDTLDGAWKQVSTYTTETGGDPVETIGRAKYDRPQDAAIGNTGEIRILNKTLKYMQMDLKKKFLRLVRNSTDNGWNLETWTQEARVKHDLVLEIQVMRRIIRYDSYIELNDDKTPVNGDQYDVIVPWEAYGEPVLIGYGPGTDSQAGEPVYENPSSNPFKFRNVGGDWHWRIEDENQDKGLPAYGLYKDKNGDTIQVRYQYVLKEINAYSNLKRENPRYWYNVLPAAWDGAGFQVILFPRVVAQDQDRLVNVENTSIRIRKDWTGDVGADAVYVKIWRKAASESSFSDYTNRLQTQISQLWSNRRDGLVNADNLKIVDTSGGKEYYLIIPSNEEVSIDYVLPFDSSRYYSNYMDTIYSYKVEECGYRLNGQDYWDVSQFSPEYRYGPNEGVSIGEDGVVLSAANDGHLFDIINTISAGSLTVTKTVSGDYTTTESDSFPYSVKFGDKYVTGTLQAGTTIYVYSELSDTDPGYTIKKDETITFTNLPSGTYTVTEGDANRTGFVRTTTYRVGSGDASEDPARAEVSPGEVTAVTINNHYVRELVDIEATKTWYQNGDATNSINGTLTNAQVTFTLQKKIGNGAWTNVEIAGNPATMTVTDANINAWKASWVNLPKYDGEDLIAYKVVESSPKVNNTAVDLPATYEIEIANTDFVTVEGHNPKATVNINNTLPKTDVVVQKIWKDGTTALNWPEGITSVQVGLKQKVGDGTASDVQKEGSRWVENITSANEQKVTFSDLPVYDNTGAAITYTVEEISVTSANGSAENVTDGHVTVAGDSWTVSIDGYTVNNTKVKTDINIEKVKAGTTEKLTGAVFKLEKQDTDGSYSVYGEYESISLESEATATLEGLTDGTYHLTETKAPAGYIMLSAPIEFTVQNGVVAFTNSSTVTYASDSKTFTIGNTAGSALPETGGSGTLAYTLGGLALIVLAGTLMMISRKRRYNR